MITFLLSKRIQFLISISFGVAYLVVWLLTNIVESASVIEFAFLTIAFGFAPAYYFRDTFKFRNLVGWILHAGTLGLLFIPFLFLLLGWLKINVIFEHSVAFLYLCALMGILSLFFFAEEDDIRTALTLEGIRKVDTFIVFVFLAFTFFLTLQNFSDFHIRWDAFTFWGLDAKFIFEQNQLRDAAFHSNVLIHRNTSFYPLYFAIIYDLYGGVFEQFASWINIYINLLAMLLMYWYVLKKSTIHKFIVAASILIVGYTAVSVVYMLSIYADMLCAFLMLVYFLILIDDAKITEDTYWRRSILLLLNATAFYFVKPNYIYLAVILIAIWTLYDWQFLQMNITALTRKKSIWLSLFGVIILWVLQIIYSSSLGSMSSNEKLNSSSTFRMQLSSVVATIEYLITLSQYMIAKTPYLLGLWWLTILSFFFVKKIEKKYLVVSLSAVLIFLLPVANYIVRQRILHTQSLLRYSAIAMYLFPLAISFVHIRSGKWKKAASIILFGFVAAFVFLNITWPVPLIENFNLSGGSYQSKIKKYYRYAENILETTGAEAHILIADDLENGTITNMLTPSIYIRYFMMNNNVGAQYQGKPATDLYNYASESQAAHILLLSYADSFAHCEQFFTVGHDYLIDIREGDINTVPNDCAFSAFVIYDLGPTMEHPPSP